VAACLALAYAAFARFLLRHGAGAQQILCVPFFAFGLGCFWHQRRPGLPSLLHLLAVAAFVPLAFTYWAQKGHPVLGYQLAWLCLLMACLFALARAGQVPDRLRRLDRWAGDLSYPLYIGHGLVVAALLSLAGHRGWTLYGAAILGAAIMAAWLHLVAETPLRRLRDRLRGRPV
jgi:peptidoglycan/LPS O-acetylase OafA/YrhL